MADDDEIPRALERKLFVMKVVAFILGFILFVIGFLVIMKLNESPDHKSIAPFQLPPFQETVAVLINENSGSLRPRFLQNSAAAYHYAAFVAISALRTDHRFFWAAEIAFRPFALILRLLRMGFFSVASFSARNFFHRRFVAAIIARRPASERIRFTLADFFAGLAGVEEFAF